MQYFWDTIIPDPPDWNWHMQYICNEMQKLGECIIARKPAPYDLIVNVPPGTSKTTICTIMFPAWLWCRAPWIRSITGSHGIGLALEQSVKSRDVLKSDKFQSLFPLQVIFKVDQDNKNLYQNIKHGSRATASTGSKVTGKHAHIILLDDLIDPQGVASDTIRETATRWLSHTIPSRKIDKANTPIILIMQRLHTEDPTGFLEEKAIKQGKRLKVIRLPADDSLNNILPKKLKLMYKKGLLDPKRLSRQVLDDQKIELGDDQYTGQYLQSPVKEGGNIIKRDWLQPFTEVPKIRPISIIQSWDTAYKKGKENAYNCCTTWEEYANGYYLVHAFWEKMEYVELKTKVISLEKRFCPHKVLVEDKSSGTPLMQELPINNRINFHPIEPEGDKVARAVSISPTCQAKNVYIKSNEDWSDEFITNIIGFPNCSIKDIMDSFSQYLNYMRTATGYNLNKFHGGNTSKVTKGY